MSMPDSPSSLPQSFWSRTVYIIAIVSFVLLWMFTWSTQDATIFPADQRTGEVPHNYAGRLDPLVKLPKKHLCTSDTYNNGQWTKHPLKLSADTPAGVEEASNYHCASNFPHKCYRRLNEGGEFERSKQILSYTWKPKKCELVPFDANKFAAYLADHPLLFVGDSINQLAFESMACLLGEKMHSPQTETNMTGGNTNMWVSQLVHESKLQVEAAVSMAFLRTDYLVRLDDFKLTDPQDDEGYVIGKGSNFPWIHALPRFHHIVINTGPHWTWDTKWGPNKSDEELMVAYKKAMTVIIMYLKENLMPYQRVWVRSTPYGHVKCSQYKEPSKAPHLPSRKPGEYQWDLHVKFDQIWKELIKDAGDARIQFFNVSNMSNLRGDAHSRPDSDCLHTCLPGPVDDWNKLLFSEIAQEAVRIP